ncbi:MAG TPA: SIMPL domain-containing protein [Terriglobales bacterium]|nr:SIMPL domain-containing protein [Terriglobales bacterium]
MKPLKIVVALLVLTGLTVAEDKLPKVVRVVGTSEVKVVPDQAVIELGVEKQSASASMAKKSADAAARSILASLHANGVDEKDIQTTFLSLQPQFDYKKGMRISYFVAEQTITVTVRDLTKLDTLLESLIKAGGNRIDSIQYETIDLRKYRDQARDLAVKAAREKAEALAKALGQEIGKAYSIEEVPETNNQYAWGYASNVSYEVTKTRSQAGPTTAAGQKTVSASVTVSFDLLN